MAELTFQVIEGLEAGTIFQNVRTPLTIGREEDNDVQLNDERISRFHAKVQDDGGRIILTDLDSTNGTRVNGHPIRMRVLRAGDLIMVGRCMLLVGTVGELAPDHPVLRWLEEGQREGEDPSERMEAFPGGPPPVPSRLNASQTAEVSDLLEYLRTQVIDILSSPTDDMHTSEGNFLRVERSAWHRLELLAPQISRYLSQIANPKHD